MPRETAKAFADTLLVEWRQRWNREWLEKQIATHDRETVEEIRERAQKYLEKHGTGINSIAELNEALGFTLPIDPPADQVCVKCSGSGVRVDALGFDQRCPNCHGTGKL